MATTRAVLLGILKDLGDEDFKEFKWFLQQPGELEGLPEIPKCQLENANRMETVDEMFKTYSDDTIDVAKRVLVKINQNELMKKLSVGLKSENCTLQNPGVDHGGEQWLTPGLRKYFCQLTLDTNTAHRELKLSENNRKVTRVGEDQSYPDHPERFDYYPQLLCRDGLTGRCYWEVEWRGDGKVAVAVSYRGISRKGGSADCGFGLNDQSWSLRCSHVGYTVWHNDSGRALFFSSSSSSSSSGRIGVYVDYPAGSLSFYRVSSDSLIHLHTFNTTFTEPLYPGFMVSFPGDSVSLCGL